MKQGVNPDLDRMPSEGHAMSRVSQNPEHWSITDEDHVCGRCRQHLTGCALCAGKTEHIIPVRRRKGGLYD